VIATPTTLPYDEAFYAYQKHGSRSSADVVVPAIVDLVHPFSVVDVGCGVGSWLAAMTRAGVADVFGLDGDHVPASDLMIPLDRFRAVDLSEPFDIDRRFDLAISMEVAEHLPAASAAVFIRSLTRLAPAILFSAAVPHQGGRNHLNEQWPEYWAELFAASNFRAVDCLRERFWNDSNVRWWYAQNMFLYLAADHWLWGTYRPSPRPLRALVHPQNYMLRVAEIHEATRRRTTEETLTRIAYDVASLLRRGVEAARRRVRRSVGA
jgi:SAM-dependent methyltransferase